jgi:hypothetical protein
MVSKRKRLRGVGARSSSSRTRFGGGKDGGVGGGGEDVFAGVDEDVFAGVDAGVGEVIAVWQLAPLYPASHPAHVHVPAVPPTVPPCTQ